MRLSDLVVVRSDGGFDPGISPVRWVLGLGPRGWRERRLGPRMLTARRLLAACLLAALAMAPAGARAEMSVAVENNNGRGTLDHFEVFDVVCGQSLSSLTLAGRTSGTITVCGDLDQPGEVRIRYDGEMDWTDYAELHSWSVIELPERPLSRVRHKPRDDDAD
jgi:hypothetical protein